MSIDHFHFVKGEAITELKTDEEIEAKKRDHTIYVMWGGIEHVYIFEDKTQAVETFEQWRREPCEEIRLTLDGIRQPGGRLPVTSCGECNQSLELCRCPLP